MSRARSQAAVALCVLASAAADAGWVLEHEEVFANRTALDASYWELERGMYRNRESQYYTDANVAVRNGALVIEARREEVRNEFHVPGSSAFRTRGRAARYTSGAIVSRRPLHFGKVEVVARSPGGAGVWPAIWLVHESGTQYGEIDLHESVGKHPDTSFAAVHFGREARTRKHFNASRVVKGFEGSWRTHTLEWTPDRIRILLDGQPLFAFDPEQAKTGGLDPLRMPMRLRINLALGGSWGGAIDDTKLPARFEIASVRVWRWDRDAPADAGGAAGAAGAAGAPARDDELSPATGAPAASPVPGEAPNPGERTRELPQGDERQRRRWSR
ncbi:glycoside hydrolase family 16 protein [Ramlibacter sp.]|uniref:glycoside hydrolase family 16 protein n=1 Tax=Ramlibacter sp. TaxID=1917967 RepID=UPI003D0FDBC5